MGFEFIIQGRLSGLNEIVLENRKNRFAGAVLKKKETERCANFILYNKVPHFQNPVIISFFWIEPDRRRDPDNIRAGCKFILDALVQTGRLKGDSRKYVRELHDYFPDPDSSSPKVVVILKELIPSP